MNITLSADKKLIDKSRAYAKKHNTTLNNLVRQYLARIVNDSESRQAADEFAQIAKNHAGKSDNNYRFNRGDIYNR
jgi:hypothetical protein